MPPLLGSYPFTVHTRHDDLCSHVRDGIDSRPVPEEHASRSVEESLFLVPTWTYSQYSRGSGRTKLPRNGLVGNLQSTPSGSLFAELSGQQNAT